MKVIREIDEMKREKLGRPSGFVPTMGYLHDGHLSLVRRSVGDNSSTVVSIFVNPTQFGPGEDYDRYPRDEGRDLSLLEKEGVDVVFIPRARDMYPAGFDTWVEVRGITDRLEGEKRPGHFRGVATVVLKLFNIVKPDRAYFGEKDYQQLLVIKKMVRELDLDIEIIPCPTVREEDGLAMSSRNTYLTPEERKVAPVIYRSLLLGRELYMKGERDAGVIKREMERLLCSEPLISIDYISVSDPDTLAELSEIKDRARILVAVRLGKARLIDNIAIP